MGENIDISFIIERFGSLEKFKKQYIQALVENLPISELNQDLKDCINKYREQLVIGFDITQPDLVAKPEIVRVTLEEGYLYNRTIGNFYNQHDIDEAINSNEKLSEGNNMEMFRNLYGIGAEKKDKREIANALGTSIGKVEGFKGRLYIWKLISHITKIENRKLDNRARERIIRKYFEKCDIFRDNKEISEEERKELIGLYDEELNRIKEENEMIEKRSIKNLGLSGRTNNALIKAGITSIDELVGRLKKVENIPQIGKKGLAEIEEALLNYGYNLSELRSEESESKELESIMKSLETAYRDLAEAENKVKYLERIARRMGIENSREAAIYPASTEEEVEI